MKENYLNENDMPTALCLYQQDLAYDVKHGGLIKNNLCCAWMHETKQKACYKLKLISFYY